MIVINLINIKYKFRNNVDYKLKGGNLVFNFK